MRGLPHKIIIAIVGSTGMYTLALFSVFARGSRVEVAVKPYLAYALKQAVAGAHSLQ
jgi:hypothetical protein